MLYFRCPTCKTILANKELLYLEEMNKNCNNPDFDNEALFDKLKVRRYCCKMRFKTYSDIVNVIKKRSEN